MPSHVKKAAPSLIVLLFRYFTAFLALYAVAAQLDSTNRSRSRVLALTADNQGLRLENNEPPFYPLDAPVSHYVPSQADTDKLTRLYEAFLKERPSGHSALDFTKWAQENKIDHLRPDYSKIRGPSMEDSSLRFPYRYMLEDLILALDDAGFRSLMAANTVDWSLPEFAHVRNKLFMYQDTRKIKLVYEWGKARGIKVFDIKDANLRPVNWLLAQKETGHIRVPSVSLAILKLLEEEGIIHLENDLKVDPTVQKAISHLDDFEIVKAFLPQVSDPQYSAVVLDILRYAVDGKYWNVAAGCVKLPGLTENILSHQLGALAVAAIKANEWKTAEWISQVPEFRPTEETRQYLERLANQKMQEALMELDSRINRARTGLTADSPEYRERSEAQFKAWWNERSIETLLDFTYHPALIDQEPSLLTNILGLGSVEHLDALLKRYELPWASPEYANARLIIFMRYHTPALGERIYRYGLEKWQINIFNLPGQDGLPPLLKTLQQLCDFYKQHPLPENKKIAIYEGMFSELEAAGIGDFKRLFGKSGREFFSQDYASLVKEVEAKVGLLKKLPFWWLSTRYTVAVTLIGMIGYFLTRKRAPQRPQAMQPEPQPRRRRQRAILPAREAVEPPVAEAVEESEDSSLNEARARLEAEQAGLLKDLAVADKEELVRKKNGYSTKQHALQEEHYPFAKFYNKLIQVYEVSIERYEAYIEAINKTRQVFERLVREPLNPDLIRAKDEAVSDLSALKKACLTAKAEAEDRASRLPGILEKKEQEFKKKKFDELSAELKSDNKPLVKLARLTDLVSEIQVVKLNEAETMQLKEYRLGIAALEARVKALVPPDFGRLAESDMTVLKKIEQIEAFRTEFEAVGNSEEHTPALRAAYNDAEVLLEALRKERAELKVLLAGHCEEIEKLSQQKGLRAVTVLDQIRPHYEKALEVLAKIGLPEDAIAASLAIKKQIEAKAKTVSAAPAAGYMPETGGAARFEARVAAVAGAAGGAKSLPIDKAAIQYTSQLLCLELNDKSGQAEETAFLALIYNFARLLELLKPVVPEAREMRNQLIHRYYVARAGKKDIYQLLEAFFPLSGGRHSDKELLTKLKEGKVEEIAKELQASAYYKNCCRRGEDYRLELRDCPEVARELANAIKGLKAFKSNKAIWGDVDKGILLAADSQPLLRDAAKMCVIIIGEILKGQYGGLFLRKLEEQACDTRKLISGCEELQHEDNQGNIGALCERVSLYDARNVAAHHVHLVSMEGLFSVNSELDAIKLGKIADCFASVVDPDKLLDISAGAAGGAGSASLVMAASAGAAGYADPRQKRSSPSGLNPDAKSWVPGGGSESKAPA